MIADSNWTDEDQAATAQMTPEEIANYRALKASPKKWTADEMRGMATNPSGRLLPTPSSGPSAVGRHPTTGRFVPLKKHDGITRSGTQPAGQGVRRETGGAPGQEPTQ